MNYQNNLITYFNEGKKLNISVDNMMFISVSVWLVLENKTLQDV